VSKAGSVAGGSLVGGWWSNGVAISVGVLIVGLLSYLLLYLGFVLVLLLTCYWLI